MAICARQGLGGRIQDTKKTEAGRHGGARHRVACPTVLRSEGGALSYLTVSPLEEETAHPSALVEPMPDTDGKSTLQGLPEWKSEEGTQWPEVWKENGSGNGCQSNGRPEMMDRTRHVRR